MHSHRASSCHEFFLYFLFCIRPIHRSQSYWLDAGPPTKHCVKSWGGPQESWGSPDPPDPPSGCALGQHKLFHLQIIMRLCTPASHTAKLVKEMQSISNYLHLYLYTCKMIGVAGTTTQDTRWSLSLSHYRYRAVSDKKNVIARVISTIQFVARLETGPLLEIHARVCALFTRWSAHRTPATCCQTRPMANSRWMHSEWPSLSLRFNNHFSRWIWVSRSVLLKLRMMDVIVTTGAISRAGLQSNRHHQQTNTALITLKIKNNHIFYEWTSSYSAIFTVKLYCNFNNVNSRGTADSIVHMLWPTTAHFEHTNATI